LEQFRDPVDLIQNHQPVLVGREEQRRVREFGALLGQLQVKVQGTRLLGDGQSQRGFSDLAWPDQGDRRLAGKRVLDGLECVAGEHPCNSKAVFSIYKDERQAQGVSSWPRNRAHPCSARSCEP